MKDVIILLVIAWSGAFLGYFATSKVYDKEIADLKLKQVWVVDSLSHEVDKANVRLRIVKEIRAIKNVTINCDTLLKYKIVK